MRKKSATLQYSTWSKIFNLANSDNDLDKTYSEILAAVIDFRVKLGITQNELAKRSGLTSSMISKFESQNSVPSIKNFLKYLKGLDLYLKFVHEKNKA
jgi:DNA-binding XRE family transcriptional regulator